MLGLYGLSVKHFRALLGFNLFHSEWQTLLRREILGMSVTFLCLGSIEMDHVKSELCYKFYKEIIGK